MTREIATLCLFLGAMWEAIFRVSVYHIMTELLCGRRVVTGSRSGGQKATFRHFVMISIQRFLEALPGPVDGSAAWRTDGDEVRNGKGKACQRFYGWRTLSLNISPRYASPKPAGVCRKPGAIAALAPA